MRAVILAAGRGSRLGPYTEDRPKCLAELGGMTLIGRQVAILRLAGVRDIVIATGYRAEALALPATRQVHNPRWETTNMVETLFCAEDAFGDDLVVAYGDIVYEPRVLAALLASRHAVSVVVDRNWRPYWEHRFGDPLADAESLRTNSEDRITDIGNQASSIDEIEAQYTGLMRFKGPGIDQLRSARAHLRAAGPPAARGPDDAHMTELLMEMVRMNLPVHAVPVEGGWLEIDTVADYESARTMISEGTISRFFDPEATPP